MHVLTSQAHKELLMRARWDFWDATANLMALFALWAFCIFAIGAALRVAVWLFCLGYGC
ncbi:MAG: hypothetical protein RJA99_3201 [Pseudomonadota bacterium]|jgi:hypothetical protein